MIEMYLYKTPCFLIYKDKFENNLTDIRDHFKAMWQSEVICGYSCKTNNNIQMLKIARELGMYAEVVSTSEYLLAKEAGFSEENIIFNGPFKGEGALEACQKGSIVNIDNLQELDEFCHSYYENYGVYPKKLGLRVNFDLEKQVPGQTSTGNEEGRFGICYENGDLNKAFVNLKSHGICLSGLHIHFTTKTRSVEVYRAIAEILVKIIDDNQLQLDYIDIGGGYWGGRVMEGKPTMKEYAEVVTSVFNREDKPTLILEPGSALCSTVMEYMTEVVSIKEIRQSRFVLLDGTSLHINPFQYSREGQWEIVNEDDLMGREKHKKQVLCGATCLENDRFAIIREYENLEKGDRICFKNTGAYTISFVSDFILEKPNIYIVK